MEYLRVSRSTIYCLIKREELKDLLERKAYRPEGKGAEEEARS